MSKKEIIAYAITHAPKGVKGGPYEAIGGDMGDTCERLSASLRWPVDNPVNTAEEVLEEAREFLAEEIAPKVPHARVIRIVRKARPFKETIPVCGTCGYDAHGGRDEESEPAPSPSEASAVEVLREARIVLALCTTGRHVRSAPEYAIVRRIGSEMGYGALMSAASASWAEMFDGTPQRGAQHTCGPCERTVEMALDRIDAVLAASGPDPMPVVRAAMRYLDHGPDGRLGPAWVGFREACEAYREAGGK